MDNKIEENVILRIEDLSKYFGKVCAVDHIDLQVQRGEFLILLGPSGCGKTTTLRLIAGLEEPTTGNIFCEDLLLNPLPPYKRPVNTVFQDYALFPHMTVGENVAYGLRVKRVPRSEIRSRIEEELNLVALSGYEPRFPRELSGGQQQRIALARALICQPIILLLDEPLGALDLKLRKEMQIALKSIQTKVGITFIHVTHDQEEAMTMADRIVVMSSGRIIQIGSPKELYYNPVNRFVADFIGETNMIEGDIVESDANEVKVKFRNSVITSEKPVHIDAAQLQPGKRVSLSVRPEKISIHRTRLDHPNVLTGVVSGIFFLGVEQKIKVEIDDKFDLMVRIQETRDSHVFSQGEKVQVGWDKEAGSIFL
jgi:spermidine/putrescine transport system ATP-binding protein